MKTARRAIHFSRVLRFKGQRIPRQQPVLETKLPMKVQPPLARIQRAFAPALAVLALLIVAFLSRAHAADSNATLPDLNPPFSAIYVLGDSLSDTGRTSRVLTAALGTAFPPPPYASGRLSNGPLWIEHFSPMVRRTYQPLDNFAWAGANTGSLNIFPGLPGMAQELNELLGSSTQPLDGNALYVVFGGSNDFLRILSATPEDPLVVIPEGVSNLIRIVRTLHASGAKHIVVVDLPNIGRTPRALAGGPATAAGATYLSTLFNGLLNGALDGLNFPVVRVSVFNLLNEFATHPQRFGFSNVTSPGILDLANSDSYLFWDDIHPTTRGHRFVGEEIFHALASAGLLGNK
jgi:phospholipase/lecithinase/hemolysin